MVEGHRDLDLNSQEHIEGFCCIAQSLNPYLIVTIMCQSWAILLKILGLILVFYWYASPVVSCHWLVAVPDWHLLVLVFCPDNPHSLGCGTISLTFGVRQPIVCRCLFFADSLKLVNMPDQNVLSVGFVPVSSPQWGHVLRCFIL